MFRDNKSIGQALGLGKKLDQNTLQTNFAQALGSATELGASVWALQQGLLKGAVASCQDEADRLKGAHGEKDPRTVTANVRLEKFASLMKDATAQADLAVRFTKAYQQPGTFHGYVHFDDGSAAQDHKVMLKIDGMGNDLCARTGTDGYFQIGLKETAIKDKLVPGTAYSQAIDQLISGIAAAAVGSRESEKVGPESGPQTASAGVKTSVQILAPSGQKVFEDPAPPKFDSVDPEFRSYVIPSSDCK